MGLHYGSGTCCGFGFATLRLSFVILVIISVDWVLTGLLLSKDLCYLPYTTIVVSIFFSIIPI